MEHWIVVADTSSCRVYRSDEGLERIEPVRAVTNATVHPDVDELGPRGATRSGPGGVRSRFDRHTEPQAAVRGAFARQVAEVIERGRADGAFQRLIVAAPPRFLGALRSAMSDATRRCLACGLVPHDYVKTPPDELLPLLRRHLTPR